jgi:hypothetical protein
MSFYVKMIVETTGCTEQEAAAAEEVMRNDLFHSTLDWQPAPLFDKAAQLAVKIVRGERIPRAVAVAIGRGVPVAIA